MELNVKIGGQAGYGLVAAGYALAKAFVSGGLWAFTTGVYPSLIRGGHSTSTIRISDEQIFSHSNKVDLLVALNEETVKLHESEVDEGGIVLHDSQSFPASRNKKIFLGIPFEKLALECGDKILRNSVALGSVIALVDYDLAVLEKVIEHTFRRKGKKVVEMNIKAVKAGYDYARQFSKFKLKIKTKKAQAKSAKAKSARMLISGNEAACLGAIKAGCKFVSAYPMTPSTSILHYMASKAREYNFIYYQPEDEIAAIISAIGASYAGARAMTTTSGGGFSLMVEGLGLSGMTETPLVIVECQRPGPSTGLPTHTEQCDLKFLLNASQGEFPRVIVAPGDAEECFYLTAEAFNIADKYQLPVFVLTDKFLGESESTTELFDESKIKIERGALLNENELSRIKRFRRYALTENGISPRSVPGQKHGFFIANSDEHDEYGYSIEEGSMRKAMMDKRFRKLEALEKELPEPKVYGSISKAKVSLIGWGSTKGPVREALKLLESDGIKANFLHFTYLNPFKAKALVKFMKAAENLFLIENNKTAQLGSLIRERTGVEIKNKILKYDGLPFFPEEICAEVRRQMKR